MTPAEGRHCMAHLAMWLIAGGAVFIYGFLRFDAWVQTRRKDGCDD